MKIKQMVIILALITFLSCMLACSSAEKAAHQRRNLMMPEKTDLPRNKKYLAPKQKKTYKKKQKKKNRKYSMDASKSCDIFLAFQAITENEIVEN